MVERIVNRIVSILQNEKLLYPDSLSLYKYGTELLVMSVINACSVMLVGIMTNHFALSISYILIFAFVRTKIGGFHASTYFRCFNCYMFIFLFLILCEKICLIFRFRRKWMLFISLIILVLEFKIAPVASKRKLKKEEERNARRNGMAKTLLCIVIMYFVFKSYVILSYDIFLVLCVMTVLMIAGKYSSKRRIQE